jgi:hypothetical protein
MGVAGLAVLLSGAGLFFSLRQRNASIRAAAVSLFVCLAAIGLALGSFLLQEHEKNNSAQLEKAESAQKNALKALEEAKDRHAKADEAPQKAAAILAKAEEAPKKAAELLKKAQEAEKLAAEAPKKAEAVLQQAQEVKSQTELLRKKAAAERLQAEEARKKAARLLQDAEEKKQEAAELQKKAAADREQTESLLKESQKKQKEAEELLKKVKAAIEQTALGLKSKKGEDRLKAARALAKLGKLALGTERALCEVIATDALPAVREQAFSALEKLRPDLYGSVVTLALPAENDRLDGYQTASSQLAEIGKQAGAATPLILRQLDQLLTWLAKEAAPPRVVRVTGLSPDGLARIHIRTLAKIAPDDPSVIQMVGKATRLKNTPTAVNNTHVQREALGALSAMAKASAETRKQILPYLVGALSDQEVNVKVLAITGLGGLGTEAKEAVPSLRALRFDQSEQVRSAVTAALAKIQPDN